MSQYASTTENPEEENSSFFLSSADEEESASEDNEETPSSPIPVRAPVCAQSKCPTCKKIYNKQDRKPFFGKCNHTHCAACWTNTRVPRKTRKESTQYACPSLDCGLRLIKQKNKKILTIDQNIFDQLSRPSMSKVINDDDDNEIASPQITPPSIDDSLENSDGFYEEEDDIHYPYQSSSPPSQVDDDDNEEDTRVFSAQELHNSRQCNGGKFFEQCCIESQDLVWTSDVQIVRELWINETGLWLPAAILDEYLRERNLCKKKGSIATYQLKIKPSWMDLLRNSFVASPHISTSWPRSESNALEILQEIGQETVKKCLADVQELEPEFWRARVCSLLNAPPWFRQMLIVKWSKLQIGPHNYKPHFRKAGDATYTVKRCHSFDVLDMLFDGKLSRPSSSSSSSSSSSVAIEEEEDLPQLDNDNMIKCATCSKKTVAAASSCIQCWQNYCDKCWKIAHSGISQAHHKRTPPYALSSRTCPTHPGMLVMTVCLERSCANRFACSLCELDPMHQFHEFTSIDAIYEEHQTAIQMYIVKDQAISVFLDRVQSKYSHAQKNHFEKRQREELDDIARQEEHAIKRIRGQYAQISKAIQDEYATRFTQVTKISEKVDTMVSLIDQLKILAKVVDPLVVIKGMEQTSAFRRANSLESLKTLIRDQEFTKTPIVSGHVLRIPDFLTNTQTPVASEIWNIQEDLGVQLCYTSRKDNDLYFQLRVISKELFNAHDVHLSVIFRFHNYLQGGESLTTRLDKAFTKNHCIARFGNSNMLPDLNSPTHKCIGEDGSLIVSMHILELVVLPVLAIPPKLLPPSPPPHSSSSSSV